jgi:hypothetical protein
MINPLSLVVICDLQKIAVAVLFISGPCHRLNKGTLYLWILKIAIAGS